MKDWNDIRISMGKYPDGAVLPEYNVPVLCVVEHWKTKGTQEAELIFVKEDDCNWRTADDNSELSYDWNVIKWKNL